MFGLTFRKEFGQNFLTDREVVAEIAESCGGANTKTVLEIGAGCGSLTHELALRYENVVALEIDRGLIPLLKYTLGEHRNIKVINADVMKTDIPELLGDAFEKGGVSVCANLPYYITTPIILELIKHRDCFSSLTVMVQKEVAERMAAKEGSKDFGSLSVHVQYYTNPEIMFIVPPEDFVPAPKVSSAVIRLDILDEPSVTPKDENNFFRVVRGAFALRRKTLVNSLASAGFAKEKTLAALNELGIDANIRGEKLSLSEFCELSDLLM